MHSSACEMRKSECESLWRGEALENKWLIGRQESVLSTIRKTAVLPPSRASSRTVVTWDFVP